MKHIHIIKSLIIIGLLSTGISTAQNINSNTAAISTVKSSDLEKSYVNDLSDALNGRLSGFFPGGLIRGKSTYSNAMPLVIVDGFEAPYKDLSLLEVESISILKDAAATAIYGLKGANGVIVVKTKRGSISKQRVGFHFEGGIASPEFKPQLLNSAQYVDRYNEALLADGLPGMSNLPDLIQKYNSGADPYFYPNNEWSNMLLKSMAPTYNANLHFTGGTRTVQYFVSLDYYKEGGLFEYTDVNDAFSTQKGTDRVNLRSNLDFQINSTLTAKVDLGLRVNATREPGAGTNNIMNAIYNTPSNAFPYLNPNNSIGGTEVYTNNPYAMITNTGYNTSQIRNLFSTVQLTQNLDIIAKGLKASVATSINNYALAGDNKTKKYAVYRISRPDGDETLDNVSYSKIGNETALDWTSPTQYWSRSNFEALLEYNTSFGNHKIDALLKYSTDGLSQTGTHIERRHQGVSGVFNYSMSNTYFADLSFSYSGSEVFSEKNRFGFFPSASAAWLVSNESWMKNVKPIINSLKVRASYGLSGSDLPFTDTDIPGRIFYNQYYTSIPGYTFGKSITTARGGVGESRLANPDIKWETSYIANIGIETDLFNCINLSFDYYNNNRKDILTLDKSMNAITGIINDNVPYRNGGEVKVNGFDLSINYFKKLADFEFNLGGLLSYSKNTVIQKDDEVLYANAYSNAVGHQIGQQFGLVSNGFFNSIADINASTVAQNYTPLRAGDVRYIDQNNDKLIDNNDRTAIGYSEYPQFVYSINGGLKYKQFDMSFMFQGTANSSTMLSGVFYPFNKQGNAFTAIAYNSWTPNNTSAKYPRLTTLENANNYRANDIWSTSLDYIKLRNVEIGYSLPDKTAEALKMTSLRFFAKGMNLFSITKELKDMDPESLTGYPTSRVVTLGVSFKL